MTDGSLAAAPAVQIVSKLFRGLSDPTRLALLLELADGEQRVTDLVERVRGTQGNVSGHLSCLKDCGLVIDRKDGRQVFYRVAHPEVVDVLRSAEALLALTGENVDICSRYGATS